MGQQLADNHNEMPLKMPFEREKKNSIFIYGHVDFHRKSIVIGQGIQFKTPDASFKHQKWIFVHVGIASFSFFPVNLEQINDSRLSSL